MKKYEITFTIYSKSSGVKNKKLLNSCSRVLALGLLKVYNDWLFSKFKEHPNITVKYLKNIDITCYTYNPLDKRYVYQITYTRTIE